MTLSQRATRKLTNLEHRRSLRMTATILGVAALGGLIAIFSVEAASASAPTSATFSPGSTAANAISTWTIGLTTSSAGALSPSNTISVVLNPSFSPASGQSVTFAGFGAELSCGERFRQRERRDGYASGWLCAGRLDRRHALDPRNHEPGLGNLLQRDVQRGDVTRHERGERCIEHRHRCGVELGLIDHRHGQPEPDAARRPGHADRDRFAVDRNRVGHLLRQRIAHRRMHGGQSLLCDGDVRDQLHLDRQHVLRRRLLGELLAHRLNVGHSRACRAGRDPHVDHAAQGQRPLRFGDPAAHHRTGVHGYPGPLPRLPAP